MRRSRLILTGILALSVMLLGAVGACLIWRGQQERAVREAYGDVFSERYKFNHDGSKILVSEGYQRNSNLYRDQEYHRLYAVEQATGLRQKILIGSTRKWISDFYPNPKRDLLLFAYDRKLCIYDAAAAKMLSTVALEGEIRDFGWHPGGNAYYYSDASGFQLVELAPLSAGVKEALLPFLSRNFDCLDWSADGNLLLLRDGSFGALSLYDVRLRRSRRLLNQRFIKAQFVEGAKSVLYYQASPASALTGEIGLYRLRDNKRENLLTIDYYTLVNKNGFQRVSDSGFILWFVWTSNDNDLYDQCYYVDLVTRKMHLLPDTSTTEYNLELDPITRTLVCLYRQEDGIRARPLGAWLVTTGRDWEPLQLPWR